MDRVGCGREGEKEEQIRGERQGDHWWGQESDRRERGETGGEYMKKGKKGNGVAER